MVKHRCKDCVYYSLKKEPGQTTAKCLRIRSTRMAFGKSELYCTGFIECVEPRYYIFLDKRFLPKEMK